MKVSFEVPFRNLNLGVKFSDYLFVLPHLYIINRDYRNFVDSYHGEKYLDNGAYELGRSLDERMLYDVIVNIRPSVFVLPDVLGSYSETVKLTANFFRKLPKQVESCVGRFMVVAQGRDDVERLKCLSKLKRMVHFEVIGLPRLAYPRNKLFDNVASVFSKDIHLLGCPNPREVGEIFRKCSPLLMSMDTSWVSRYALGIGESRKLDFERDELDESKFTEAVNVFFQIIEGVIYG